MITCIFPPSNKEVAKIKQQLREARDERLALAGCSESERVAFYQQRIEKLVRKS